LPRQSCETFRRASGGRDIAIDVHSYGRLSAVTVDALNGSMHRSFHLKAFRSNGR
jgi:hypothetical protein